jgi:hypothetical protein
MRKAPAVNALFERGALQHGDPRPLFRGGERGAQARIPGPDDHYI